MFSFRFWIPRLSPEIRASLTWTPSRLLLEHIAIAKCSFFLFLKRLDDSQMTFLAFGRINGYTINPNQELIGIGVTNTVRKTQRTDPKSLS
jgi:MFS superfamily sulfate permease-like transporter